MDDSSQHNPQNDASDPSASQSSIRRIADVSEIEELQRAADRRRKKRRKGMVLLWLLIFVVVALGIYALTARSLVRNARQRYREVYRNMELETYRAYNPAGLQRAERTYRATESMNPYLQMPAILKEANEALEILRRNYSEAQDNERQFEQLREKYSLRRQEAREVGLPRLLPEQWGQVRELERSFRREAPGTEFDYREAKSDLEEAVEIFDSLRGRYDALREYAEVFERYQEALDAMALEEWEVNRPGVYARLQELRSQAQNEAASQNWRGATQSLREFLQLRQARREKLTAAREAARAAVTRVREKLQGAEAERIRQVAEQQFKDLKQQQQSMEEQLGNFRYEEVREQARKMRAEIQTLREKIDSMASNRETLLEQFNSLYEAAAKQEVVFRRNWPERWNQIQQLNRRIRTLAPEGRRQLELIQTLEDANKQLKELVNLGREEAKQAFDKRNALAELTKAIDMELLRKNQPQEYERIRRLQAEGQNYWEQRLYAKAAQSFAKALARLQDAQGGLAQAEERALALQTLVFARMERYAKGLAAFRPRHLQSLEEKRNAVKRMMDERRFGVAVPQLEAMQSLLPEGRYDVQKTGTVLDFVSGLMWGGAAEVAATERTWYRALTFADELTYGGYSDWRLPEREELLSLQQVSEEERKRLLPTLTAETAVWTSENVERGGDTAYAVSMGDYEVQKVRKQEQRLTLPVRAPGE